MEVFFILAFAFTSLQIPLSFRWQVGDCDGRPAGGIILTIILHIPNIDFNSGATVLERQTYSYGVVI
jgi:hypothetical protein